MVHDHDGTIGDHLVVDHPLGATPGEALKVNVDASGAFERQAHRTLLVRALKGLEDVISLNSTHWFLNERGWQFKDQYKNPLYGVPYVKELFLRLIQIASAVPPFLFFGIRKPRRLCRDLRMMDAFDRLVPNKTGVTFYSKQLQSKIDSVNEWIYETVNNGVYQAGFATFQTAYEDAVFPLFKSLDRIEGMLSKSDYLVGNTLTEADIRLWTTIIRFDPVYHG
ncbi:S-glutathionyl-(chloro)hydroquinone reductase [Podila minutissima]|uniref:S-glutathionyl-(Chloro)hydroquinone reductase n=1 Tax=Podila minutissima TaxID=64525 RepID=A0A9P5SJF5_9FUNG|nr:S-glutathionyl-(chloro)hydroquinone reductase [Podila minutissima]